MTEDTRALVIPAQPGELMATRANEMAKAMLEFLPGGNTLPEPTRKAMAMLAVNNGLDPFLGEVYAVPQKRKDERTGVWSIVGYTLGIGRGGWLRNAERSGLYQGNEFRFCTPEEERALGVNSGDVAQCCNVFKAGSLARHSGNYRVSGFGVVSADEKSKMNHFQLARKRAFVDALRNAFPMIMPRVNGATVHINVVDEETGEVLGNGHDLAKETAGAGEFTETPEPPTITVMTPTPAPARIAFPAPANRPVNMMTTGLGFPSESVAPPAVNLVEIAHRAANIAPAPAAPVAQNAWSLDAATRNVFWAQATAIGYSSDAAKNALGIQDLRQFAGSYADAIDKLMDAKEPVELAPFDGEGG